MTDEEYDIREKARGFLYQYGMTGGDPDNVLDALADEGIVLARKPSGIKMTVRPAIESHMIKHAEVELTLIGEEPETIEGYIKVVQAFADMDHSGGSASVAIPVIVKLLMQENLKPLTDDPDEWMWHDRGTSGYAKGLWQNKRNSKAFSLDAGKTYWLVDETTKTSYGRVKKIVHTAEKSERTAE